MMALALDGLFVTTGPTGSDLTLPVNQDCWPGCAANQTKIIIVRHPLERLLSAYRYVFDSRYDIKQLVPR